MNCWVNTSMVNYSQADITMANCSRADITMVNCSRADITMENCSRADTYPACEMMRQSEQMSLFVIPAALLSSITLLVDPFLLYCIVSHLRLREETRYVLLSNVFLSDILFLVFNLAQVCCNALRVEIPCEFCHLIVVSTVTTCCCTILTLTLMVVDTLVAIRWPLQYARVLHPRHVKAVVVGVWVISASFPIGLILLKENVLACRPPTPKLCLVFVILALRMVNVHTSLYVYFTTWVCFCTGMICYCYVRLYMITRDSGIWRSHFSRARLTLLLHTVVLLGYFTPCFLFTVQLALYDTLEVQLAVWLNTLNATLLMLLPRTCSPYLYGLRYRELYYTVRERLGRAEPRKVNSGKGGAQKGEQREGRSPEG